MNSIRIIHEPSENEPYIIVYKPHNLPTAPLSIDDENNLLSLMIKKYPEIKNVKGRKEIEYGLVHRIDNVTSGLVLIACNQKFYNYIIDLQKDNKFIKEYKAICQKSKPDNTFPEISYNKQGNRITITSYFRYFGPGRKEVRPVSLNSNKKILDKVGKLKEYTTEIFVLNESNDLIEVVCRINNGFKHQVRCHLAALGLPIKNDPLYSNSSEIDDIQFEAISLEFDGKKYSL